MELAAAQWTLPARTSMCQLCCAACIACLLNCCNLSLLHVTLHAALIIATQQCVNSPVSF